MNNVLPWDPAEFKETFVEAVEELRLFQNHAADMLRECGANNDPSKALQCYEEADAHYKKAIRLAARLSLRFYRGTAGRPFDHTKEEEIQLYALAAMVSGTMNSLLSVHRISLKRDQDAKLAASLAAEGAS